MLPRSRLSHERKVLLQALAAGLPAVVVAFFLLWNAETSGRVQVTVGLLIVGLWLGFAFAVQGTVVRPLQTISNLLAAFREEER